MASDSPPPWATSTARRWRKLATELGGGDEEGLLVEPAESEHRPSKPFARVEVRSPLPRERIDNRTLDRPRPSIDRPLFELSSSQDPQ